MADDGRDLGDRSVADLLKQASDQTAILVRQELELAKAELTTKGKQVGLGAGMFGAAGVFGVYAFGALTLPELSQIDLAKVDSYGRKNDNRTTVLSRITALRRQEPWPGYAELTVAEIEAVLDESDEQRAKDVVAYERSHKNRAGVLKSAERETANA